MAVGMLQHAANHGINRFDSGCAIIKGLWQGPVVLPEIGCSLPASEVQVNTAHVFPPADHLSQEAFQRIQRYAVRILQGLLHNFSW